MAEFTSITGRPFANEKYRVWAEAMVEVFETSRALVEEWDARPDIVASIPASNDVLTDGSETDGRPRLSGNLMIAGIQSARDIITYFNVVVTGQTRITWFRRMTDKGQARF